MKKVIFLLITVFSLVSCSGIVEKWNPRRVFKEEFKSLGSDLDNMTNSKYNLEQKVEENL